MKYILHNTAVTKQWTKKWPLIANVISELYKIMTNKSIFVGFRGRDRPNRSPLDPPVPTTNSSMVCLANLMKNDA